MKCDSMIETVLSTETVVVAGGTIPVGNAVHGYGKAIAINGNGIAFRSAGYYKIFANFTLEPATADSVTITANVDGIPLVGATTSTAPVSAGDPVNGSLQGVYLIPCSCSGRRTLTFTPSNGATITNFSTIVEKE